MKTQILEKLTELKKLARNLEYDLESSGLRLGGSEASIAKAHLFDSYLKNIITATEGLMRGEPAERHNSRLAKDFDPAFEALEKVKASEPGRKHAAALENLDSILKFIQAHHKDI